MKISSKGQITIPKAIRQQSGLHPRCEVEFELLSNGGVLVRLAKPAVSSLREALERVRGSANASAFKHMGTDAFMACLRG